MLTNLRIVRSSLEWSVIEIQLVDGSRNLPNSRDIEKMIKNIGKDVSILSKAEVEARRIRRPVNEELINSINQNIELVTEYILIAKLIN